MVVFSFTYNCFQVSILRVFVITVQHVHTQHAHTHTMNYSVSGVFKTIFNQFQLWDLHCIKFSSCNPSPSVQVPQGFTEMSTVSVKILSYVTPLLLYVIHMCNFFFFFQHESIRVKKFQVDNLLFNYSFYVTLERHSF